MNCYASSMIRRGLCLLALIVPLSAQQIPPDAAALKAKRDAKIAEINSAYYGALSKLADRYAAAGEAEKAAAVKALMDGKPAEDVPDEDARLQGLVGKWRRDYDSAIFEFVDTRSGNYNGETEFAVKLDAKKKAVVISSKMWVDRLEFGLSPDVLRGGAHNRPYRLTRIK